MIDPEILDDYKGWLHVVANSLVDRERHDDLVQEGRIAMWRALETYDETRGSLPSWLTRAAEMRMRDLAWGTGQPTGHEAVRGSRPVEEGPSLDGMVEDEIEALLGHIEEAYHDGEVMQVIRSELSPKQQEYVFLRFWGGLDPRSQNPTLQAIMKTFPVLGQRHHWQRSKAILREHLEHLGP